MNTPYTRFRAEIRHFYRVSLLNLVFAALAIAFSVTFMVSAVSGQESGISGTGRFVVAAIALAGFGLGISWLLTMVRIFQGVETIRDALDKTGEPDNDRTTCLVIRMLAHYRDNRTTIHRMIQVCTLGGVCFFVLAVAAALRNLTFLPGGGSFTMDSLAAIPGTLLTLGIALVSLVSSRYFSRFANSWDLRLGEIDANERCLKNSLFEEGK